MWACYLNVGLIFTLCITLSAVYETVQMDIKVEWTSEVRKHYQNNATLNSFLGQQIKSEVRSYLDGKHCNKHLIPWTFCELPIIFPSLVGARKNMSNELVLYVKPSNKGFIIPLLFQFLLSWFFFSMRNTLYGLISASYRLHKEYVKDENNTNKTITVFLVTNEKNLSCF